MDSLKSITNRLGKEVLLGRPKDRFPRETTCKIPKEPSFIDGLSPESVQKLRSKSTGEWAIYKYTNKE